MQASVKADAYYKYMTGMSVMCLLLDTEKKFRVSRKIRQFCKIPVLKYASHMKRETD